MDGNHHFGNIGDVWKHLALCAMLDDCRPAGFWETHAGAASYDTDDAPERLYGVRRYLAVADEEPAVADAAYTRLLRTGGGPESYPGSPVLSMGLLDDTELWFADVNAGCVDSIRAAAADHGCPGRVNVVPGDGVATVAAGLAGETLADSVVHIDPFQPFQATEPTGLTPVELFGAVAETGAVVVFWYALPSADGVERRVERLAEALRAVTETSLWCGETLATPPTGDQLDPGLAGSLLVCANLPAATAERCEQLGSALAAAYEQTDRFPALSFRTRSISRQ